MKKPAIIVIGISDVIKLGLIRSLGKIGYKVISIHLSKGGKFLIKPLDYYSKYVSSYYFVNRSDLIDFLVKNCTDNNCKPVLFTLDDYTTFLIDESREVLINNFQFAHLLNNQPLSVLMNKHLLKAKAREVGLKVADGWPIFFEDGEFILPKDIKYPCFLKGLNSFYASKGIQCRCDNEKELIQYLEICKKKYPHPVYAEEYIPIEKDLGVIGISDGNNSIIPAKAELQEMGKGSSNGVSMLGKVSSLKDDVLLKQIKALMKDIHYIGIFNIDFVESQGQLYFVELNFRFAAYGYSVFCAGCNIPALFVNILNNNENKHLQVSIDNSCYYINEKIAIVNLFENNIRLKKYRALIKKADCTMVRDKKDPKPFRLFYISAIQGHIVRFLKSIYKKCM